MKKSILLFILIFTLGSCVRDILDVADKVENIDAIEWNPTIAVPLIYSRLAMEDVIGRASTDEFLRVETDGSLTLVYKDEYVSLQAESLFELSDQSFSETFTLNASQLATLNSTNTLTIDLSRTLGYVISDTEIDRILLKTGTFSTQLSTTLEHDVSFTLSIREGTIAGTSFSPTVSATSPFIPNVGTSSTDLKDLAIDFTQTAKGHSEMEVDISLVITKRAGRPLKPVETITYTAEILDQAYQRVDGLFGVLDFTSSGDTLEIPFFENNDGGTFTLADPRIKFVFANSAGVDVDARTLSFDGTNTDQNRIALTGLPDPLPFPGLDFTEIGQEKKDSLSLNKNTSNLSDFINNRPANIYYQMDIKSSPGSGRQWLLDTSKVRVEIDVEIPLEGTAKDFALVASQPFDLTLENSTDIKEVLIRLYTENGFPVDVSTQVFFEDSISNTVVDSLIVDDKLILPSGTVDASGRVASANPKTTDILLNAARVERILSANRIRLRATFDTPSVDGMQPDVKFFSTYDLLLQLGVQAEILVEQQF